MSAESGLLERPAPFSPVETVRRDSSAIRTHDTCHAGLAMLDSDDLLAQNVENRTGCDERRHVSGPAPSAAAFVSRTDHDLVERALELCLLELAEIASERAQPDRAMRLYGAVSALRSTTDDARTPAELHYRGQAFATPRCEGVTARQQGPTNRRAAGWLMDVAEAQPAIQQGDGAEASSQKRDQPCPRPNGLTGREVEVLRLVASGSSNNEIAEELVVSVHTAERHIANIYAKIGARGRADAAIYALRHGLLQS